MGHREVDEVAQTTVNTIQVPNLARSAMAPEIRATVMIANTAWKATNARAGIAAAAAPVSAPGTYRRRPMRPLSPKCWNGLPTSPCQASSPNASL